MKRLTLLIERVEVDPLERRTIAGAPHDVSHIYDPSVLHDGRTISHRDGPGESYDSCSVEIFGLDTAQRQSLLQHLRPDPSPNWVGHAGHSRNEEPEGRGKAPVDHGSRASRFAARVPAREPRSMRGRRLERNLRAGVCGAHHQDVAVAQLGRSSVVARVELKDADSKGAGEVGSEGALIPAGSQHDIVRLEPIFATGDDKAVGIPAD